MITKFDIIDRELNKIKSIVTKNKKEKIKLLNKFLSATFYIDNTEYTQRFVSYMSFTESLLPNEEEEEIYTIFIQ